MQKAQVHNTFYAILQQFSNKLYEIIFDTALTYEYKAVQKSNQTAKLKYLAAINIAISRNRQLRLFPNKNHLLLLFFR